MANTLIPIQTYTLTSTASSVTFSNIPQNYTDLKVIISARSTGSTVGWDDTNITFNGSGSYSSKYVYGSSTSYGGGTSASAITIRGVNGNATTASIFSNSEVYIYNYTSGTAKTVLVNEVTENNSSSANSAITHFMTGLWTGTSAITTVTITVNANSFTSGSTFTLYGISNGVKATGGTLTVAGGYAYHTFTSTGSFLPNQQIKNAEVLAVAGGGGGGSRFGGGGGAGGVLYSNYVNLNAGTSYTALVGSGGAGSTSSLGNGTQGANSVLGTVIAIGGGYGGGTVSLGTGGNGGSGGGGTGVYNDTAGQGVGGSATSGQGNAGGTGGKLPDNSYYRAGGGGGGAGAAGTTVVNGSSYGPGGIGTSAYATWHSITGTGVSSGGTYYIAGGGGGGIYGSTGSASGGTGGGGAGLTASTGGTATAGSANTGGGGGGAGSDAGAGGAGGSGLIIVRYPLS